MTQGGEKGEMDKLTKQEIEELAKIGKREYMREWENENRKRRREYQREYYKRNSDKILQYQKTWRKNNPEKVKAYNARYWAKKALEKDA